MIRAWRLPDGRYRLEGRGVGPEGWRAVRVRGARGSTRDDPETGEPTVADAAAAAGLGAERVFGVVAGPSSCGCEPAGFRWVVEEVDRGVTDPVTCPRCGAGVGPDHAASRRHDIVDVCGEADVAEAVYRAEFAAKLEALAS